MCQYSEPVLESQHHSAAFVNWPMYAALVWREEEEAVLSRMFCMIHDDCCLLTALVGPVPHVVLLPVHLMLSYM